MSSRLPSLSVKKVLRALTSKEGGFYICHKSSTGGHVHLCHPKDETILVVVPMHSKDRPRGTLMSIVRQSKLTQDQFRELL